MKLEKPRPRYQANRYFERSSTNQKNSLASS
jgi:hypothetical protein